MSPHVDPTPSSSSVCEDVCAMLSSIIDGRATPQETTYANAHLASCPECASHFAFLRATKAAWARQPMSMPPLDLSARIAAATYAKPTFAQRFASFIAFLQPAPVRVAVGVATVAGLAFLIAPRMELGHPPVVHHDTPAIEQPVTVPHTDPVVAANNSENNTSKVTAQKQPGFVPAPIIKPQPSTVREAPSVAIAQKITPKEVAPRTTTVEPAPVVASAVNVKPVKKTAAPVVSHPAVTKAPVQIASNVTTPKPNIVHETTAPRLSSNESGTPEIAPTHNTEVAAATTPTVTTPIERPDPKEPTARVAAVTTGMTAPETDPDSNEGGFNLSKRLRNAGGRAAQMVLGGKASGFTNVPSYALVSAPMGRDSN